MCQSFDNVTGLSSDQWITNFVAVIRFAVLLNLVCKCAQQSGTGTVCLVSHKCVNWARYQEWRIYTINCSAALSPFQQKNLQAAIDVASALAALAVCIWGVGGHSFRKALSYAVQNCSLVHTVWDGQAFPSGNIGKHFPATWWYTWSWSIIFRMQIAHAQCVDLRYPQACHVIP